MIAADWVSYAETGQWGRMLDLELECLLKDRVCYLAEDAAQVAQGEEDCAAAIPPLYLSSSNSKTVAVYASGDVGAAGLVHCPNCHKGSCSMYRR